MMLQGFSLDEFYRDIIEYANRPGRLDGRYLIACSAIGKILSIYFDTREYFGVVLQDPMVYREDRGALTSEEIWIRNL